MVVNQIGTNLAEESGYKVSIHDGYEMNDKLETISVSEVKFGDCNFLL